MRYFFGFILAILLIVGTFVLVLRGFHSGESGHSTATPLANYATTDTTVQFTDDGPVTADQTHEGLRINVGQYATTIQVFRGYQNDVTSSQTFENNPAAYGTFLRAISLFDYTSGIPNPNAELADPRGVCPTGDTYTFQIISGDGSNIQNYWTTSCGGGTFKGNLQGIVALFRAQVPDYSAIAGAVAL
jgi:hypothetical protein